MKCQGRDDRRRQLPLFPPRPRMVCADWRAGRADWAGRRRVSIASADVRDRLRCPLGGAAEFADESDHARLFFGGPQPRRIARVGRATFARNDWAACRRHCERLLWRASRQPVARQPPRPTDRRVARLTRPVDDRGSVPAVSIGRPVAGERDGAFYRGRRHRDRRRAGQ